MKVKLFFAWYDFRVGFYWDRDKGAIYIAPLPCIVFKMQRPPPSPCSLSDMPTCPHPRNKHTVSAGCIWHHDQIDKYCSCDWRG